MSEETINKDGGEEEATAPQPDEFGVTISDDGSEVTQEKVVEKEEDKSDEKDKEKKTPEMAVLETKLEEYSKNLIGQNDVISKLQAKIATLESGGGKKDSEDGKEVADVLFKEIKYSKDLTEEQRDDMTPTEIALYDANATQQEAMNKMFKTIQTGQKTQEEAKVSDLNSSANTEASKLAEEAIKVSPDLAKDARELADKIIVEFNEFNNDGISQEKLVERMKKALNNVSGYTPPKEQEKKSGGGTNAVKDGADKGTDPFGVDAIVAGVNKPNEGEYKL